ncbi:UPF0250 protein YbeD [Buchnera aphidicola (Eriosoma grossulariae)]|uniref:DUF493 family protein YbeD n=1 Tax=Buchnera aphidicola TaxID=9 RepID=UPI003463A1AC
MRKKLQEMLTFPCYFTYKIIGLSRPELIDQIIRVVQLCIPGDYVPQVKSSNKGNYLSISITICANDFTQIEQLYNEISQISMVRMVF